MESNVLVVDDSAAIRKILQRVLRQTGMAIHTIHEAGDGQEALVVLTAHKIDLVLSDINMPKMDGLQLLASMKGAAQWRQIPVVMITTEGGETKVSEAVKLGAAGYVRKPPIRSRRSWQAFWNQRCPYEPERHHSEIHHRVHLAGVFHHARCRHRLRRGWGASRFARR